MSIPGSIPRSSRWYKWSDPEDTELIHSAAYGDFQRMKKVLASGSGCNINHQNSKGFTAIAKATEVGSVECVQMLLENNADANLKNIQGMDPLLIIVFQVYGYNQDAALKILKMLVSAGANVDTTIHGESALLCATATGMPELVRELLSCGANIHFQQTRNGYTPLMIAAKDHKIKCLDVLLEFHPNVNQKDFHGNTTLIHAVMVAYKDYGIYSVQCVRKLIHNGIDVNASNHWNQTALYHVSFLYATKYTITILKMLLRAGINRSSIWSRKAPPTPINCIHACYNANFLHDDNTDYYFSFLRLLFVAGECFQYEHRKHMQEAIQASGQSLKEETLYDLCRTKIRCILLQQHRKNLFETVPILPLPTSTISYLLYNEEL